MPTVIAIDCSFSLSQLSNTSDGNSVSKLKLAGICCLEIIERLSEKLNLEHFAIVSFSSNVNVICDFTRDISQLKSSINKLTLGDKSTFRQFVSTTNKFIRKEWGCMQPCNIIVITDGRLDGLQEPSPHASSSATAQLFDFDCQLYFLCLETASNMRTSGCYETIEKIMEQNRGHGSIHTLLKSYNQLPSDILPTIKKFLDDNFQSFHAVVQCGSLKTKVTLYPKVNKVVTYDEEEDFEEILEIVGFLNISDLGNAPVTSRHLVLPIEDKNPNDSTATKTQPCFTVLLHGSLKTENKVALVRVAANSFGIISSWNDNKTKSNLVLSLFTPGFTCVPWLGDFRYLGPASLLPVPMTTKKGGTDLPTFPAQNRKGTKRSYAQPTVAWTRPTGLQTDVQKILRSVKKLPEKSQVFYKDLNRLRRAALAFGFHELLEGISQLLERECIQLPGTAHPEAALQLSHAARELKASVNLGYDYNLEPLKTDFKFHNR
uniref:Integrator complex subunit 14 n=1 Tax=Phallusia mammillata TaxID=59560 RepID=A0A6F9DFV4_9ASCI|nr:von Willebrand factor A domain-containing protein 9-like [Phallusia mammillata]